MVSLMSDSRVMFLIWFVVIAIVVAGVLIFVEVWLKRKKARESEAKKEKTPIDRMKISLSRGGNVRKKLDVVSKTAKSYFKEDYGISLKSDYSELVKEFKKRGKPLEVKFCEGMFEAYYSEKKVADKRVGELGDLLGEIYRKKKASESVSNVPNFWDKVGRFFGDKMDVVLREVEKYVAVRREGSERRARVVARKDHELLNWVKRAIGMGYDKVRVSSLLDDGGRSRRDVKRALNVYDKEASRVVRKNNRLQSGDEGGVAQNIIRREKDRLDEMEALGVKV